MMDQVAAADPARIARVLDFETTGFVENPDARVCEIGFIDVDLTRPEFPIVEGSDVEQLVDPLQPIPPEVSAIHHIIDADVTGAPDWNDAGGILTRDHSETDVYCAHNTRFEQHFFSGAPRRWIDTYRCALLAWPEAPNHTNQGLRYWLGLDVDRYRAQPPHRALPDAYVTAHILRKLLLLRPISRLVEISSQPGFLPKLTFGKHYGETFKQVEFSYLEWIVKQQDMDEDVLFTANYWLKRRA